VIAMSISALGTKFANSGFHKISAKLGLKVDAKIFDVLHHLFARAKIHLLLLSLFEWLVSS